MTLKLLQLNVCKGTYLPSLLDYVSREKIDILHLQEVTGGKATPDGKDIFEEIKKNLDYQGELAASWTLKSNPASYFGNATFFRKDLIMINKKIIRLKDFEEIDDENYRNWASHPNCALSLDLETESGKITLVNAHLAWGPTPLDQPYKTDQANVLLKYMESIKDPFILTGDFNLKPQTTVIESFNKIGRNLTVEAGITNTLNPKTHRAKELFPKGIPVDYIFVSQGLKVSDFKLVQEPDISDHFGLTLTFQA